MAFDPNTILDTLTQVGSDSTTSSGQVGGGATPAFTHQAATLSSQYSVKGMSYPEDLMENPAYGANRVLFYINVSVDSRVLAKGSNVAVVEGIQRDMRGQLIGQRVSTGVAGAVTGITGAGVGALGGSLGFNQGKWGALAGAVAGVGGTALIAGQANNAEVPEGQAKEPTFTRPQKRLKTAIALYIPNQLAARYSVSWGEEDTFGFSAAAAGAEAAARATGLAAGSSRATGLAGEILAAMATSTDAIPFGKEQGIAAGLAQNPKKEQAFKNVDFRTFAFEYQFAPRSEAEAANVLNIIRSFKYHMHPEFKSTDAFLYVYPSEFDITYYKGGTENLNIHRHTSCVLTEMNVNYTPGGVFTTFPNGMPTQISMTLTFKELMLLSKETIEKYT